jgi:hypothetical protein
MGNDCSLEEISTPFKVNNHELKSGDSYDLQEGDRIEIENQVCFYTRTPLP